MTTFALSKINNNNLKIRAMKQTINVSNKAEVKAVVTSETDGGYNYFEGDIRKGNLRAHVTNCFYGNKLRIQITYWEDGKSVAVETASTCSTAKGIVSKVSKFLNVK